MYGTNIYHFINKKAYICIMPTNMLYKELTQKFSQHGFMSRKELLNFFQHHEPKLSEAAVTWKIFDLKRRHVICSIKKDVYALQQKPSFEPVLDAPLAQISKFIREPNNLLFPSIWDTIWINDFTEMQATSSLIVLEVEKGEMETVFFLLRDKGFSEVFVKPDENIVRRHVSEAQRPIIIKPLVSRSPLQSIQGVCIPTLEKILVDLYCDDRIFFAFQGHQLAVIFRNVLSRYTLNFSTLLAYAKRRHREEEIKNLLLDASEKELKIILQ
jgi:hypothetical protein